MKGGFVETFQLRLLPNNQLTSQRAGDVSLYFLILSNFQFETSKPVKSNFNISIFGFDGVPF
jgi:hypothetical protein